MIVVTGGAGFIGSVLLWKLNENGIDNIIVVDNLGKSSKWNNLVKRRYVDYINKDRFLSLILKDALPFKVSAIVHLGACSSTTEGNADFLMENNFHYSQEVCKYALSKGIRFINASSAATYGDGKLGFSDKVENIYKLKPLNMYGYSKQLFDLWLLREKLQDNVISLKFFNVFGPNEYHKGDMQSVIAKAYAQIHKKGHLSLFKSTEENLSDGEQKRDFVYVKDCASIMFWLLENPSITGIHNVGTGFARTFNDLAKILFSALDMKMIIDYFDMPKEMVGRYQNYTCADMDWLKNISCPVAFSSLEDSVTDYIHNYLSNDDKYI